VQKLEEMVLEMVASYEDCTALTQAIKAVPEVYQPSDQVGVLPAVRIEAI
jgi:E3 SUMO-protein ligase NSE2